jgi:SET domain-containing protein
LFLIETYIKESNGKGFGTFTKNFVPKGTIIWKFMEGFDIKVHVDKLNELNDIQKDFIDKYFWKEGDYYYSSCDHSIFQNHSYKPNSIPYGPDEMIASTDIQKDEEIVVSYNQFDDEFNLYKNNLI